MRKRNAVEHSPTDKMSKTAITIAACIASSVLITSACPAQSLPKLYSQQQTLLGEKFLKNKKYCESLYNKAKYESTDSLPEWEERMRIRYYIKGDKVYAIYKVQPSEDGTSCNRPTNSVLALNKKTIFLITYGDFLFGNELKQAGRKPSEIYKRYEYEVVREQGGTVLVKYEKDLAGGKISRTVFARALQADTAEKWTIEALRSPASD